MNILFIWDGDYPWDIRVEKVCNTLMENGHSIHLVCRNIQRQNRYEEYKGLNLHRVKSLPKFMGILNNMFTFPAFFSPVWFVEVVRQIRQNNCEIIIIRDLPLAPLGIFVGKLFGIPTILDMAECYPEMLRCTWKFEGFKLRNVFLRNSLLADFVEYFSLKSIDYVWVMIEESRDRLLLKGVLKNKIRIVSNTPDYQRFDVSSLAEGVSVTTSTKLKLTYIGLLNPSRGVDTVLRAIREFVDLGHEITFVVVGRGKDEKWLKELSCTLGIDKYVEFKGWIDNAIIPTIIINSDVCIVPHHKCSHWENTIPNKLFDYMAAGKVVIVSDVTPMARIVQETNCGLIYKDLDIESLCDCLCSLQNPANRHQYAMNGRTAIEKQYNWRNEEKVLLDTITCCNKRGH